MILYQLIIYQIIFLFCFFYCLDFITVDGKRVYHQLIFWIWGWSHGQLFFISWNFKILPTEMFYWRWWYLESMRDWLLVPKEICWKYDSKLTLSRSDGGVIWFFGAKSQWCQMSKYIYDPATNRDKLNVQRMKTL